MPKNPLVLLVLGILIGLTIYFKEINLLFLYVFLFLLFIFFIFSKKTKLLLILLSVLFGYFYTVFYFKVFISNLDAYLNQKNIFIGEVISKADSNGFYGKKYLLKVNKIIGNENKLNALIQVFGSSYEEYLPGDVVQITGVLKEPKGALLPGLFDEKRYLLTKGVNYTLKADTGTLVFLDQSSTAFLKQKINNIRDRVLSVNEKHISKKSLEIINGIVLGSKASNISQELKEKIRDLGLAHITSASGFNVSILAFVIFWLFRITTKSTGLWRKVLPVLFSIFSVLSYAAIADFSSSIIRATVFIILVLIGSLFDKKLKLLPGISLILLLFFLFSPLSILDIGLQLSLLGFLGLALFFNEVNQMIIRFHKVTYYFMSIFLQSLIAQIMVIPLIVFYFHNIQLLGFLANIVAVPLAGIILIVGLTSVFLGMIPIFDFLNLFICKILDFLGNLFIFCIDLLYKIPFKQIFIPNINFYLLLFIYIFIFYILSLLLLKTSRERIKIILPVFIVLIIALYFFTNTGRYLKIFCLKKYNSDQVLIIPPGKSPMLITNKTDENDVSKIEEYLRLNNISHNLVIGNNLFHETKSKMEIKYKNFSFDLIKNYSEKVNSNAFCLKLPILMKNDPPFYSQIVSLPQNVILNDYKRLSKSSLENINWLSTQMINSYFLSKTGTILIITDGSNHKIKYLYE